MTRDTAMFKQKLEEEKKHLLMSLADVGQKNPTNLSDWEGRPEDIDQEHADSTDVADNIEEYESNTAVVAELEVRLGNIDDALRKIEAGTYGVCEIGGEEIEEDRLHANPAAKTCKAHINN